MRFNVPALPAIAFADERSPLACESHRASNNGRRCLMLTPARNVIANVKNRFIPLRYLYKGVNRLPKHLRRNPPSRIPDPTEEMLALERQGHFRGVASLPSRRIEELQHLGMSRAASRSATRGNNYPFVDLLVPDDFKNPDNPIIDFIFGDDVLQAATWYFRGKPKLTRCFLAYSKPDSEQRWTKTQLWHLDSDDFRILRFILYLTDVDQDAGPFMFVPKDNSPRLGRFWARRLDDAHFRRVCNGSMQIETFLGGPGSMLAIDTAQCCHCGGRAVTRERLALVITFTTQRPCNSTHPLLTRYGRFLFTALRDLKPHISEPLLRNLLLS